jgi:quinol monooxygenase YgiN
MSGRRRHDDGWDEGRRDPWSEGGADGRYPAPAPSFQPVTEQATSYDVGGNRAGNGNGYDYDPSAYDAPGYGGGPGYGGQNGAANGYQSPQQAPGYGGAGYGDSGYGQGGGYGYGNDSGYGGRSVGFADANGATGLVPEFMSAGADYPVPDAPAGPQRPIGRLSIYTLLSDKVAEFDRLAERAAEGVRMNEPDTLVYVIHVVPKAPLQRIVYEIYRNRAAFESHERQPHIRQFVADRAYCVLVTNVIDLRLKYAKVTALGAAPRAALGAAPAAEQAPAAPPASRSEGPAAPGDQSRSEQYQGGQYGSNGTQYSNGSQYGNGTQYNGDAQYNGGQYNGQYGEQATVARTQYQAPAAAASAAPAASFTPAGQDRYAAAASQYAAAAGQYTATGQYGYAGGGQAANGGQYQPATEYPATSGYPDAGGYQGAGYQATATYQANGANGGYAAGTGYSGGSGYSGAAGQQAGDGYSNGNGYPGSNGNGYSGSNGYSESNGYSGSNGHSGAGGAYFTPAGAAGGQYPAAVGQSAASAPVTGVRRRELGSGAPSGTTSDGANGHQAADEGAGGGYAGGDSDASRPDSAEWSPPRYSDQGYRSS